VVVFGLIAFCSYVAEGAAIDWSAVYVHERGGAGAAAAAGAFAGFSLAMAASRLVGDGLAGRFGPVRLARASCVVAIAGLALALLVPGAVTGVIGFALVGAGLAPIVPTAVSAAGDPRLGDPETVISRMLTIAYVGSIIGPALIGFVAGHVGLRGALVIPIGLIACVALASGRLAGASGGR
jgi:fucose permease